MVNHPNWWALSRWQSSNQPACEKAIKVDGIWGRDTTRALQEYFNSTVDGIISGQYSNNITRAIIGVSFANKKGSTVIRLLQKHIGAKVDGHIGPETVRALQRHLKTPVDGIISRPNSLMVRELQRRLNNGTF